MALYTTRSNGTNQIAYLHKDHLGSVELVTDESGIAIDVRSFDAWGKPRNSNWTDAASPLALYETHHGYTGHEHLDEGLSLIHMNARLYDPKLGRFIQADPIGIEGGMNLYGYAANNPLAYVDTTGRNPQALSRFAKPPVVPGTPGYQPHDDPQPVVWISPEADRWVSDKINALGGFVGERINWINAVTGFPMQIGQAWLTSSPLSEAGYRDFLLFNEVAGGAEDFFAGTNYTDKVLGQMKQGDLHSFPESVKAFQEAGQASKITGGDGIARDMLKIPGEYRGKQGDFEFIKEADGSINHRLFRPAPGQ